MQAELGTPDEEARDINKLAQLIGGQAINSKLVEAMS